MWSKNVFERTLGGRKHADRSFMRRPSKNLGLAFQSTDGDKSLRVNLFLMATRRTTEARFISNNTSSVPVVVWTCKNIVQLFNDMLPFSICVRRIEIT